MTAFIDAYDVALSDLDGVHYRGELAVEGSAEAARVLQQRGVRLGYVTNNAAPSRASVAAKLVRLGFDVTPGDVITSAQVGGEMLRHELPAGSTVLVCGTENLADEVRQAGMIPVASYTDKPDAVLQGYDPEMTWPRLYQAALAVQHGARWFATNPDLTRPTEDGLVPGMGAMIYAIAVTTDQRPQIAGKPYRPLLDAAIERLDARRPVFVGDRIDTDIMGAYAVGIDSFFVFTGSHGVRALCEAPREGRPTAIGWNFAALLEPARVAELDADGASCGRACVTLDGRTPVIEGDLTDREVQLDAAWALANLVWAGKATAGADVLARFDLLP
ncbi:MAG: HAD-IIA family hydrolase [Propioniciclava sp.]|uniref:HAD-IIA family hydrolase n=1 Tax=Propioniciclava sp. TaxID=2038686 RepID=UPI0039E4C372